MVNAVLAQAGGPVRAARLRLSPLSIGATLRVLDSLQSGKSRFFAEITRLRQIVALTDGPRPVLFLLDEILHGTNSHDRRIGTEAVLRGLSRPAGDRPGDDARPGPDAHRRRAGPARCERPFRRRVHERRAALRLSPAAGGGRAQQCGWPLMRAVGLEVGGDSSPSLPSGGEGSGVRGRSARDGNLRAVGDTLPSPHPPTPLPQGRGIYTSLSVPNIRRMDSRCRTWTHGCSVATGVW